jgi:hypothetical protein
MSGTSGLSKLQKDILAFVREKGYTTAYDATELAFNAGDFKKPFSVVQASARASASRALRRLVNRGLLVKVPPKYERCSTVFVDPDFTDEPPVVERRFTQVEMYKNLPMVVQRLSPKLTVSEGT